MEEKKVDYFKLPQELAQAIVNYLGTKPYQEVYQVMPAIMNLEGVIEEEPQAEADKDILDSINGEGEG